MLCPYLGCHAEEFANEEELGQHMMQCLFALQFCPFCLRYVRRKQISKQAHNCKRRTLNTMEMAQGIKLVQQFSAAVLLQKEQKTRAFKKFAQIQLHAREFSESDTDGVGQNGKRVKFNQNKEASRDRKRRQQAEEPTQQPPSSSQPQPQTEEPTTIISKYQKI